uniref:Uncharacterized protein n=1 Tax=Sphaerodactylus townsendi TaxID=933632 RepID=A0ACB8EDD4_9SAUR
MSKAKEKSLRGCCCCIEALSGFLLLMLVASTITLLRYFLEFHDLRPTSSGNKTDLLINVTTTPRPSSQSFASAEMLPQSSIMSSPVSQKLTTPLTSSSPRSPISFVSSTVLQQASPTDNLQQRTSDRRKTQFPKTPTEKTSLIFPSPLVSVTQSTLLRGLASPAKQSSPQQLLTLPVKWDSPQQLSVATEKTSQRVASTMKPTLSQKQILRRNVTHSEKPLSGQMGEEETDQYFKGSFSVVNETYCSNYSDPTSRAFRNEALKLENMVSINLDILVTCTLVPALPQVLPLFKWKVLSIGLF